MARASQRPTRTETCPSTVVTVSKAGVVVFEAAASKAFTGPVAGSRTVQWGVIRIPIPTREKIGPGQHIAAKENMSAEARAYQERVAGAKFDATLSATCGGYSKYINNRVILDFNKLKILPLQYLLGDIFAIMIKIFDPDKAVINFSGNFSAETGVGGALVAPPLEYYKKK